MIESIVTWCGLITTIAASLAVLSFALAAYEECSKSFWRRIILDAKNTKEWAIYRRWSRRYRGKNLV